MAQPDEEFGNFATRDTFPDLVPKGEIWISEKLALGRACSSSPILPSCNKKRQADGISPDRAYDDGLEMERLLRERLHGVEFRDGKPHKEVPDKIYLEPYVILPDPQGPVKVWIVDGNLESAATTKPITPKEVMVTFTPGCRGERSGSRTAWIGARSRSSSAMNTSSAA